MSDRHYDVAFAGLGASACILIHELHSAGWLNGKKIAIIEPSDKKTNDRTFCFWAEPDSQLVKRFKPIISHSWDQVSFNGIVTSIGPLRYHHVRGIDLYDYTKQIIGNYSPDWINSSVERCASEDQTVKVFLPDQTITTPLCFDSRTVPMPSVEFPEVAIHQSFLGFKVRLRHAAPDAAFATLMDFDFEQDGFTQFIYRLPFAPDHMLIELTRFGDEKVDPIQAAPQLESYIRRQYGHFEILEQEYGCIPMVYTEQSVTSEPGIIPLGTRAGMVKASTGYAFKNMFDHAQQLSKTLLANQEVSYQKTSKSRFRFYDHLLLIILKLWPGEGRRIFDHLLSSVPAKQVLTFLYEKTTLREEINIFSKLPVLLFLKALIIREWFALKKHRNEWVVVFGAALAVLIGFLLPDLQAILVWPLLIAGLILIGIPHGAVDDMLQTDGSIRKIDFRFISYYLLQSAVMLIWWWIHSPSALLAFLAYSAWHFGQADVVESGVESSGLKGKFNILLQGAGTLAVILLSHVGELNSILVELNVAEISLSWSAAPYLILGSLVLNSLWMGNRKLLIGYFTLLISFQLPLLMAFGIYFIFQHSLRGWQHIRIKFNKSNLELFRSALPFHIGAWIMLGLMYWFLQSWPPDGSGFGLIGIFFVFLSSLSFPHVLAMNSFYRKG